MMVPGPKLVYEICFGLKISILNLFVLLGNFGQISLLYQFFSVSPKGRVLVFRCAEPPRF